MQQQLTEQQIQQQLNEQNSQIQTAQQLNQITQIPQLHTPSLQQTNNLNKPSSNGHGWMQMPSFFNFGGGNKTNLTVSDMDMVHNQNGTKEEKRDILLDDDDDDVLGWNNDYGLQPNPLYDDPKLLKTKAMV